MFSKHSVRDHELVCRCACASVHSPHIRLVCLILCRPHAATVSIKLNCIPSPGGRSVAGGTRNHEYTGAQSAVRSAVTSKGHGASTPHASGGDGVDTTRFCTLLLCALYIYRQCVCV